VAETFLRRWFGGKRASPAGDEARAEIDRLLADRPDLRGPLGWLHAVLDDLVADPEYVLTRLPAAEVVREKYHAGRPLLVHAALTVEPAGFARRWRRLFEALEKHQPGSVPPGLADVVRRGRVDPNALATAWVNNGTETIRRTAGELGASLELFGTLLRFALFAGFTAIEADAAPLRQGAAWDCGHCPTCGSAPLLAEFRGLDQSRFLRCGLCAASWEVSRQWCPACGNRDHESLGFLAREGEESRYRVATCDACRTAIKTLSTLSALPPLMLLVADAATLHLDLAAADRGYTCPPRSTDG
jgi:FdhE protein